MKNILQHTYTALVLFVSFTFVLCFPLSAAGIRITPQSVTVSRDSLRLDLAIDLREVRVPSGVSLTFTPMLRYNGKQLLLPSVVITGARRERFARRERELSTKKFKQEPYRILVADRKQDKKQVQYRLAVPYASWMSHASLGLLQESKDCCVERVLGIDTLTRNLNLPIIKESTGGLFAASATDTLGHKRLPVSVFSISHCPSCCFEEMVTYLTPEFTESVKRRTSGTIAYIDYHQGNYEVDLTFRNNQHEINKIDSVLSPLLDGNLSTLEHIRICGYASPEGVYSDNERLSSNRSRLFMRFVREAYGIPERLFEVSSVAEDWVGVTELLNKTNPPYRAAAQHIIDTYGVFQGRERLLMELQGGEPYKDILHRLFPKLRRIEFVVSFSVRDVTDAEAVELIYTHPELLSLQEIYNVSRFYRPGTEQYREVYEIAAYRYPNEVTANVNAAGAALLLGDVTAAWNYLRKVDGDPRTYNNLGVLSLIEGDLESAESWFRKAIGTEPEKARKNLAKVQAMRKGRPK